MLAHRRRLAAAVAHLSESSATDVPRPQATDAASHADAQRQLTEYEELVGVRARSAAAQEAFDTRRRRVCLPREMMSALLAEIERICGTPLQAFCAAPFDCILMLNWSRYAAFADTTACAYHVAEQRGGKRIICARCHTPLLSLLQSIGEHQGGWSNSPAASHC